MLVFGPSALKKQNPALFDRRLLYSPHCFATIIKIQTIRANGIRTVEKKGGSKRMKQKKLLSLLLAAALVFSLAAPAAAEETTSEAAPYTGSGRYVRRDRDPAYQ